MLYGQTVNPCENNSSQSWVQIESGRTLGLRNVDSERGETFFSWRKFSFFFSWRSLVLKSICCCDCCCCCATAFNSIFEIKTESFRFFLLLLMLEIDNSFITLQLVFSITSFYLWKRIRLNIFYFFIDTNHIFVWENIEKKKSFAES